MATSSSVDDRTDSVSVLVVDADPVESRYVAESLELADPAVSATWETDPDAAIDAVADGGIDCVVTDVAIEDVDGLAFLDRVARTDEAVRAVVHTDEDDPAIAQAAWSRGAAYARRDAQGERYDVLARHIIGRTDHQ